MKPISNLRDAMFQAGKFGHVEAVQDAGQVSYQVRKGFGNWLVHVVKWYSNRGYKERIIQQRVEVLNNLNQLCGTLNPPETQSSSFSDRRMEELNTQLAHGLRFQAQSICILADYSTVAENLVARQFKTDDAALKNLHIPGTENDINPHHGVDKEKFGAAYWQHAYATAVKPATFGVSQDPFDKDESLNAGMALLEYALSKDEDENYEGTGLFQHKSVPRNNDLGIDFETWGIPDGVNNIELRLIHGSGPLKYAQSAVNLGSRGQKALADRLEHNITTLDNIPNTEMWELSMRTIGMEAQLAGLCGEFMQDENMGGGWEPVPS